MCIDVVWLLITIFQILRIVQSKLAWPGPMMPVLAKKFFLYMLRAAVVFLLHISELESYLPMFREALDYAGFFPHFYLFAMAMVG